MTGRNIVSGLLCLAVAACSEPTQPGQIPTKLEVIVLSPTSVISPAESDVASPPSIKVQRTYYSDAVIGVPVVFSLTTPDDITTSVIVPTDARGVATLPVWHIGSVVGKYTASAAVAGLEPVVFTALMRGATVAIYDLDSIGGQPRSLNGWPTEGHYVLFEDGSYNTICGIALEGHVFAQIDGTYERTDDTIRFFIDPKRVRQLSILPLPRLSLRYRHCRRKYLEGYLHRRI